MAASEGVGRPSVLLLDGQDVKAQQPVAQDGKAQLNISPAPRGAVQVCYISSIRFACKRVLRRAC